MYSCRGRNSVFIFLDKAVVGEVYWFTNQTHILWAVRQFREVPIAVSPALSVSRRQ